MKYLAILFFLQLSVGSIAQSVNIGAGINNSKFDNSHVNWSFSMGKVSDGKIVIEAVASIEDGWHIFPVIPAVMVASLLRKLKWQNYLSLRLPLNLQREKDGLKNIWRA